MILVTGATGRLGRHLVPELLKRKEKVRIIAIEANEAKQIFGNRVEIIEADLSSSSDFQKIASACKNVSCIVHLAALVDYTAPKEKIMKANFFSTMQLIEAALMQEKKPRFVFLSSTSVYRGNRAEKISEQSERIPLNDYGWSKLLSENALEHSSLPYLILRSPIIYGNGFTQGFGQVAKAISKGKMRVIGDGSNVVSFIHYSDVLRALLLAVYSKIRGDFIISSGEKLTQKQLLEKVSSALKVSPPKRHVSKKLAYSLVHLTLKLYRFLGKKPKLVPEYVYTLSEHRLYDVSKAKKILKFTPRVPLDEGLEEFVPKLLA